jgi:Dimethlysulfonioproprionate lyase
MTTADGSIERARSLTDRIRSVLEPLAIARPFLEGWPERNAVRVVAPATLPVCRWLPGIDARAAPETVGLVRDVVAAADSLAWRHSYSAADFGAAFLEAYGWVELIGTRGAIPSGTISCGLLLLGPDVEYPAHEHEAEELYLPLAGMALWLRGTEPFVPRAPGTPIFHGSWMPHAMRTVGEPMLAAYMWRGGDLAAKPAITGAAR